VPVRVENMPSPVIALNTTDTLLAMCRLALA